MKGSGGKGCLVCFDERKNSAEGFVGGREGGNWRQREKKTGEVESIEILEEGIVRMIWAEEPLASRVDKVNNFLQLLHSIGIW